MLRLGHEGVAVPSLAVAEAAAAAMVVEGAVPQKRRRLQQAAVEALQLGQVPREFAMVGTRGRRRALQRHLQRARQLGPLRPWERLQTLHVAQGNGMESFTLCDACRGSAALLRTSTAGG